MNAISLAPPAAQTLDEAVAAANLWTVTARPIVTAMFALIDAQWDLLRACDDRTSMEVKPILDRPVRELNEMLDGIRDNFLCDEMPPQPGPDASDDEWQARDDFQDELAREVTSVAAFIKQMEREA